MMKNSPEHQLTDSTGAKISVKRAKTAFQLKRNASLIKASELLKKDDRCKNKSVAIVWKMDGSKDRVVRVDGRDAFRQRQNDTNGSFLPPFENLSP